MIEDSVSKVGAAYISKMDGNTWSGNTVVQKLLHIQLSLVLGKGRLVVGVLN